MRYILTIVFLFSAMGSARADVIFEFDVDVATTAPDFEKERTTTAGQVFTANLIMTVNGPTAVGGYSISVRFDNPELNVEINDPRTPPSPFIADLVGLPITTTAGEIQSINASAFAGSVSNFSGTIASFSVTATNPLTDGIDLQVFLRDGIDGAFAADGTTKILPGITPGDGGLFVQPGASINAVPEPGSLWLGLMALAVGVRRRSRRA